MTTVKEISITYRPRKQINEANILKTPESSHSILRKLYSPRDIAVYEQFFVLYLDTKNEVLGVYRLSKGGISSAYVDIRILLAVALKCLATAIIIAHNHPSGNTKPSQADIAATRKIKQGGFPA